MAGLRLVSAALASGSGLTAEFYRNSVMRGTPYCTRVLPNGFNVSLDRACGSMAAVDGSNASVRITGTLTAPGGSEEWYHFAATVGTRAWVRLWVDDHRLVDEWMGPHAATPTTPGLLPNVSMDSERGVSVRVDLRPWDATVAFELLWRSSASSSLAPVPASALSPAVSAAEAARRALQERVATGWNQWARHSQLAQIVLPQQVGVELSFVEGGSGRSYAGGLVTPTHGVAPEKNHHVRMGMHAYNGSYSHISAVPFPAAVGGSGASALNFSVRSATDGRDNLIVITNNASTAAAAAAANVSVVVAGKAYWGAAAVLAVGADGKSLTMDAGELGTVTVTFSHPPLPAAAAEQRAPTLRFAATAEPLVVRLSFSGEHAPPPAAQALRTVDDAAARLRAEMEGAAGGGTGALTESYEAMHTVIAWNVNFDPRVAVTCPVSRTFESGFDFIFFDWCEATLPRAPDGF